MPDLRVQLASDEVHTLLAYLRRHLEWDARSRLRVRCTGSALGVLTSPPFNVLALFAVPSSGAAGVDITMAATSLVTALEVAAANRLPIDLAKISEVSVPVTSAMSIAFWPPQESWSVLGQTIEADLAPFVDEAVAEFSERSAGLPEDEQQVIADEMWNRTVWVGVPIRMLHAARQLGMLGRGVGRLGYAESGSWRRLSTPRGQILIDTARGAGARPVLNLLV